MSYMRKITMMISVGLALIISAPSAFAFTFNQAPVVEAPQSNIILAASKKRVNPKFKRRNVRIETT